MPAARSKLICLQPHLAADLTGHTVGDCIVLCACVVSERQERQEREQGRRTDASLPSQQQRFLHTFPSLNMTLCLHCVHRRRCHRLRCHLRRCRSSGRSAVAVTPQRRQWPRLTLPLAISASHKSMAAAAAAATVCQRRGIVPHAFTAEKQGAYIHMHTPFPLPAVAASAALLLEPGFRIQDQALVVG